MLLNFFFYLLLTFFAKEFRHLVHRRCPFISYIAPQPTPNTERFRLPRKHEKDHAFLQPFYRLGFFSILRWDPSISLFPSPLSTQRTWTVLPAYSRWQPKRGNRKMTMIEQIGKLTHWPLSEVSTTYACLREQTIVPSSLCYLPCSTSTGLESPQSGGCIILCYLMCGGSIIKLAIGDHSQNIFIQWRTHS